MSGSESERVVEVVPYDESWPSIYEDEAKLLRKALGRTVREMHHIGSTAIPGMWAKPVIDILVVVNDIDEVDLRNHAMEEVDYKAMGEYGIKGRRFFTKGGVRRSHHVHVFQEGSPEIQKHIDFRDFMISHPAQASRYADLKRSLASVHRRDIDSYCNGKDAFIRSIDAEAAALKDREKRP